MIELGQHWEFIAAAYLGSALVVGSLVVWIAREARRTRAGIDALEAGRKRKRP